MVKLGKTIFITAFAALATFLVISASSVYITTENDLKSLEVDFSHLIVSGNGTAYAVMKVNGSNSGFLPSTVMVMNNKFTVNPESSLLGNFTIPANMTQFQNNGWPMSDFSLFMNIVISELMGGFNISTSNKNYSAIIPPFFSSAQLFDVNNSGKYKLVMTNLLPIVSQFFYVAIYVGNEFVGNMTPATQSNMISGNVSLFGNLAITSSQMNNASFMFAGSMWQI
ncbi:MAG: hypothetical protein M1414_04580 [Candidatus Thermoplasmatota archaeon]|jgi:hypothetical protein|nr:hypothetical protein [Candidatus Thermoplasmatota archaeon]